MAISIKTANLSNISETKVQLLPCKIDTNGKVKIEELFESTVKNHESESVRLPSTEFCPPKTKDGLLSASMRGRPLIGEDLNLPKGYTGRPTLIFKSYCINLMFLL